MTTEQDTLDPADNPSVAPPETEPEGNPLAFSQLFATWHDTNFQHTPISSDHSSWAATGLCVGSPTDLSYLEIHAPSDSETDYEPQPDVWDEDFSLFGAEVGEHAEPWQEYRPLIDVRIDEAIGTTIPVPIPEPTYEIQQYIEILLPSEAVLPEAAPPVPLADARLEAEPPTAEIALPTVELPPAVADEPTTPEFETDSFEAAASEPRVEHEELEVTEVEAEWPEAVEPVAEDEYEEPEVTEPVAEVEREEPEVEEPVAEVEVEVPPVPEPEPIPAPVPAVNLPVEPLADRDWSQFPIPDALPGFPSRYIPNNLVQIQCDLIGVTRVAQFDLDEDHAKPKRSKAKPVCAPSLKSDSPIVKVQTATSPLISNRNEVLRSLLGFARS